MRGAVPTLWRPLIAAVLVALFSLACSSTERVGQSEDAARADDAAVTEPTDSDSTTDPGSPADPPTTPPGDSARLGRDVPPLALPPSAPGTDEAAAALLAELDRFVTDDQRADGVPWPDLRNPDPVAVYRSCAEFQNWMSEHNTTPWLVEAYTAPASPERGWDLDMFQTYNALDVVTTPSDPPYEMRVDGVVHPAATDITDALLASVPDGSVAVVYWDSVGSSNLVGPDGNVYGTTESWTDKGPWVAIMAPTEVGWQVWWDELTEVPPPGLDDDRGLPLTPEPRRDV